MEEKALQRFTISPPLMGFPDEEIIPNPMPMSKMNPKNKKKSIKSFIVVIHP